MKKVTLLALILMAGVVIATGCKKAEKTPEGATAEDKAAVVSEKDAASTEDVSDNLSKSLCKRMVECAKGPEGEPLMKEEECVTQTKTSLAEALKQKPVNVSKTQLDACISTIAKSKCEEVMGAEPPKNCEFLN
jgi:flagellar biosynthesis/type III secretory pathway M-ring protein FliF/YscJ